MFPRGRRRETPLQPDQQVAVHAEAIAVASPDYVSIGREATLRGATGRTLQGVSGTVVQHDRGDPSLTFERVAQPVHDPTRGIMRIGTKDRLVLDATVNDDADNTENLTPYQKAMFARIAR